MFSKRLYGVRSFQFSLRAFSDVKAAARKTKEKINNGTQLKYLFFQATAVCSGLKKDAPAIAPKIIMMGKIHGDLNNKKVITAEKQSIKRAVVLC